jgi:hypothetical protein
LKHVEAIEVSLPTVVSRDLVVGHKQKNQPLCHRNFPGSHWLLGTMTKVKTGKIKTEKAKTEKVQTEISLVQMKVILFVFL